MMTAKFLDQVLILIVSALMYFASFAFQVNMMKEFDLLPMASMLFIPASIKFIALLVGGFAGLAGLAIGSILVEVYILAIDLSFVSKSVHILAWLILPYICLLAYIQRYKLKGDLGNLNGYHVILMAVVMSFVSSLGTQLVSHGIYDDSYPLLKGVWSMMIGDISGIFLVFGVGIGLRRLFNQLVRNKIN